MSTFPCLNENHLEQVARILGQEVTSTQLTNLFRTCRIHDISGESTKWKRIYDAPVGRQQLDRCGNNVAALVMAVMSPGRFIDSGDRFEQARRQLNAVLMFDGLELNQEGVLCSVPRARTIGQAEQRAQILGAKIKDRKVHPEVLRFCTAELLEDNYFHAVFEATKSLAQRIRDLTGLHADGTALVDEAFALRRPLLAFNSLQTETEKSEHVSFAMLLKGCFAAIRNPRAHEPKILWGDEDDETDYLTLIALLYRKLDETVRVPCPEGGA